LKAQLEAVIDKNLKSEPNHLNTSEKGIKSRKTHIMIDQQFLR